MIYKNKILITPDMKISDMIFHNPYIILVLEHFGIKMGVHEKTIEQICKENKINKNLFLATANLFNGFKASPITEYTTDEVQTIINYLKNNHTYYLNEKYPEIQDYIKQIYKINKHPEILLIDKFFDTYFTEVKEHLDYENEIVFPYVLNLKNKLFHKKHDNIITDYSVTDYKEHHNDIEEKLTDLKNLLIKYLPIKGDQQLRRKLIFCLFELEYDLKIHSHIEEYILMPLVEKMEQLAKQTK